MNKTITVAGKDVVIRSLKWGEKNRLKAEGFNIVRPDPDTDNDELVRRVVELTVEDKHLLDEMDILDVYEVYQEVLSLSFQGEKEKKTSG